MTAAAIVKICTMTFRTAHLPETVRVAASRWARAAGVRVEDDTLLVGTLRDATPVMPASSC